MTGPADLPAGDLGAWAAATRRALRGEIDADVPCGDCTACCTASQFVHIAPDETDTLAHVPRELLFPAPRLPRGHVLLGYDEHGRCPMLTDDGCSIYAHRPRTCRTYDCRVLAATGVDLDDGKPLVAARVRRWRFALDGPDDEARHLALRAAAAHLDTIHDDLDALGLPVAPTQLAVLAVEIHELFLRRDDGAGALVVIEPDPAAVRDALVRFASARSRTPGARNR